jgi:phosphoglycerate dehydrogenase-like enzyme
MSKSLTLWCNAALTDEAKQILSENLSPHRLLWSSVGTTNLAAGAIDPTMAEADVVFGQPDPQQVIDTPNVKWVHLSSAGYTRYDTDAFRSAIQSRGAKFTNSSSVYCEPCAEHALAMVLAIARQLPQALDDQRTARVWHYLPLREKAFRLSGQSMLIFGYGAIAKRLVELLAPFRMKLTGVRRAPAGDEGIPMVTPQQADALLGGVDHVMNILPASPSTDHYFNAKRLSLLSPKALFYNIGRGSTVDQQALGDVLQARKIAGAYLDVTTPEPLPPSNRLWDLPNCWITPHTAGGHRDEFVRLARHFRENLQRYVDGQKMVDLVMGEVTGG